jgi:hypothetical protein
MLAMMFDPLIRIDRLDCAHDMQSSPGTIKIAHNKTIAAQRHLFIVISLFLPEEEFNVVRIAEQ